MFNLKFLLFFSAQQLFRFTGDIVVWRVPASGPYTILALGAQGGYNSPIVGIQGRGLGASMQGVFDLVINDTLSILVGEMPPSPTKGYDTEH